MYSFVTQEKFFSWNPYLHGNCDGLWEGYYYCVMAFEADDLPMPATVTTQPAPVQTGIRADCKAWYMMTGSDTCELIASIFGTFSAADFIAWNPAVKKDCSGLRVHLPVAPFSSRVVSLRACT